MGSKSLLILKGQLIFCPSTRGLLTHCQILLSATEQEQANAMMRYTSQKDKALNDDAGIVSPGGIY